MRLGHTVRRMTYIMALFVLSCLLVGPVLADGPLYTPAERLGVSFLIRLETPDGWINQSIATYDLAALSPGWYTITIGAGDLTETEARNHVKETAADEIGYYQLFITVTPN